MFINDSSICTYILVLISPVVSLIPKNTVSKAAPPRNSYVIRALLPISASVTVNVVTTVLGRVLLSTYIVGVDTGQTGELSLMSPTNIVSYKLKQE